MGRHLRILSLYFELEMEYFCHFLSVQIVIQAKERWAVCEENNLDDAQNQTNTRFLSVAQKLCRFLKTFAALLHSTSYFSLVNLSVPFYVHLRTIVSVHLKLVPLSTGKGAQLVCRASGCTVSLQTATLLQFASRATRTQSCEPFMLANSISIFILGKFQV